MYNKKLINETIDESWKILINLFNDRKIDKRFKLEVFKNLFSSFLKYPKEWNFKLKDRIKLRDKNRCQLCFKKDIRLAIHHINYNKKDCDEKNLITLCSKCHGKTNANRDYWVNLFNIR